MLMAKILEKLMTVSEFLDWVQEQPRGRYELVRGEVIAMSPERALHALTKHRIARVLEDAVRNTGLDCIVFPDGMTVSIDEHTAYEPDAVVQCGRAVDMDSILVEEPLIVVEVLSPKYFRIDMTEKLVDYFRVASIHHYLIFDTKRNTVTHHRRLVGTEDVATRILRDGALVLDPPGLTVNVAELFLKK
jgi:Uma2 family endonuclease